MPPPRVGARIGFIAERSNHVAEILVNSKQWEGLGKGERQEVEDALRKAGALGEKDVLTPSDDAPDTDLGDEATVQSAAERASGSTVCKAGCVAVYATERAHCSRLSSPAARAACNAIASTRYNNCMWQCARSSPR